MTAITNLPNVAGRDVTVSVHNNGEHMAIDAAARLATALKRHGVDVTDDYAVHVLPFGKNRFAVVVRSIDAEGVVLSTCLAALLHA